ncbi:MAG: PEGA domain-containing protein [Myxococcaceae bacterium]|nr:PEGA domain-containing protein [Myxococcaceae bacterium]
MRLAALLSLLSFQALGAETIVFVNAANDGPSGLHSLKVLRDAVVKADPTAEKAIKSSVVLEEPTAHVAQGPKQVLGEVNRLLTEGKAAYNRGNLDGATEAIAQATAMAMSTEPWPETFTAIAELERLTGLISLKLKDSAAADEAFRNAFLLNPQLQSLDSAMGVYARMLKSKDRGTGQVVIKVDPLTAWVMIDGQKASSGVSGPLEAGTHFISASREGYTGQLQRITVPKGKIVPVNLTLLEATNEPDLVVARATVLAAQTDAAMALGAKKVSELMKARFVVLVRPDDAAIYDATRTQLGSFTKIDPAVTAIVDALRGAVPKPLITDAEVKNIEEKRANEIAAGASPDAWYQKPWVIGAGAGAVVVVVATIVTVAVVAKKNPPTYTFNNWCYASDCPPRN